MGIFFFFNKHLMVLWNLYFSEYTFRYADGIPYLINKDTESQEESKIFSRSQGHLRRVLEEENGGPLPS